MDRDGQDKQAEILKAKLDLEVKPRFQHLMGLLADRCIPAKILEGKHSFGDSQEAHGHSCILRITRPQTFDIEAKTRPEFDYIEFYVKAEGRRREQWPGVFQVDSFFKEILPMILRAELGLNDLDL